MERARPTLRCLRDDLKISIPLSDYPLDEIDHPLLAKANEQFADHGTPHERIASVDDQILFRVKINRWRGAVWQELDLALVWLVAAGLRESGSPNDFYASLVAAGQPARKAYNSLHTPPLTPNYGYLYSGPVTW